MPIAAVFYCLPVPTTSCFYVLSCSKAWCAAPGVMVLLLGKPCQTSSNIFAALCHTLAKQQLQAPCLPFVSIWLLQGCWCHLHPS